MALPRAAWEDLRQAIHGPDDAMGRRVGRLEREAWLQGEDLAHDPSLTPLQRRGKMLLRRLGAGALELGSQGVRELASVVRDTLAWRPTAATWQALGLALVACLVYLGVALFVLRPVLGQMTTSYIGSGELEGWLWRYWWMKRLVLGALDAGRPLYALYVALVSSSYPETGNVFDLQWFSMPLEALCGAPAYYNLKALLFLLLNGMAGYWLGRALVADWTASVICGLAFGFGSYGLIELDTGRIRHLALFPMALYALSVMRLQASGFAPRRAVVAGLAFGLCSATYLYYGMSVLFFSFIWLFFLTSSLLPARASRTRYRVLVGLWLLALLLSMMADAPPRFVGLLFACGVLAVLAQLAATPPGVRALRAIVLMAVVGGLASMPYATWYLEQTFVQRQALREVTYFQSFPTLQTLIAPQNVHTSDDNLLNSLQRFRGDSPSWDMLFRVTYRRSIPVVLTALAALGLLVGRRRPWLWACTALLAYLVCLGPYLRQGLGEEYVRDLGPLSFEGGIPTLHLLFFKYVPYFSRLFSPIRMEGLFVLGYCVVVAWATVELLGWLRLDRRLRPLALLPVVAGLLWQMEISGQSRLSTTEVAVPDVYAWLVKQPTAGIIELPYREGDYLNYYQIFHEKRVLGNWASGSIPPGYPEGKTATLAERNGPEVVDNPLLGWLRQQNDETGGQAAVPVRRSDVAILVGAGYRYAILHERGSFVVQGSEGHAHYVRLRDSLTKRFGDPVYQCKERLRDRAASPDSPASQGGAEYDIVVFDLSHDLQPN